MDEGSPVVTLSLSLSVSYFYFIFIFCQIEQNIQRRMFSTKFQFSSVPCSVQFSSVVQLSRDFTEHY